MSDKKKRTCHNTKCMWNDGVRKCVLIGEAYNSCEAKRVITGNNKGTRYIHDSTRLKERARGKKID